MCGDHGSGPRSGHRQICRCRKVQESRSARPRGAGAVLPQRKRAVSVGRGGFLRLAFQHWAYPAREIGPGCISEFLVTVGGEYVEDRRFVVGSVGGSRGIAGCRTGMVMAGPATAGIFSV